MTQLVYLGPEGTFTHQAALALSPPGARLIAEDSLEAVLAAVETGRADYAVAAETSVAGPIAATCEALQSGRLHAAARHAIAVSFDLYRRPGDTEDLVGIYGHEKALSQVSAFVAANALKTRPVASNTAGLLQVRDAAEPGWGAAGPPGLGAHYELEVTAHALEGPVRHETVFVLLRRPRPDQGIQP